MKKIIIASDHAGFKCKQGLKDYLEKQGNYIVVDLGPSTDDKPISYATQGLELGKQVAKTPDSIGIGVCGSGIGISIAANRVKGIRAARITSNEDAELAKKHNNANVLIFGGRQTSVRKSIKMLKTFEKTEFEGGRHNLRIQDLDK